MRREFLVGQGPGFHAVFDQLPVRLRAVLQEMQQRQCRFALPKVLPKGLAQMLTVGGIVQCIVRQLECDAQPLSEPEQRLL